MLDYILHSLPLVLALILWAVHLEVKIARIQTDIAWLKKELPAADPGLRFLGQIQIYRTLWLRDPPIAKIERPVLVAESIDPDILDAAGMYSVMVFIV